MIRNGWSYLYQIVTLLFAITVLSSCCASGGIVQNQNKESVYDRVMRSGKIRCGYVIYSPGCLKDPNTGKLSGIGIDSLELITKKLGLKIEWVEEVGWGTMLEGLQTGRYDIVATPVWTNANRAKLISFSRPLFYSPLFIYVRKGDKRFVDNEEKINSANVKIATVDGETGQVIADADFPQAKRLSLPQMTDTAQLLLNVSQGKADITIQEPAVANDYIRHNPDSVEKANPNEPIRVFPNCWMFKRGEFEFKAMLDTVLDEVINGGAMDKIINKYAKRPGEIYPIALPYKMPK